MIDPDTLAHWEERAGLHRELALYQQHLRRLREDGSCLDALERDLVGDVRGRDLIHLQCHIGTDTLSWALAGARVVGVDFSPTALAVLADLAREFSVDVETLVADVQALPSTLDGRFDVVVTGWGALGWLGDLPAWAEGVARVLRPGGKVVVTEFHPLPFVLADETRLDDPRLPLVGPTRGGVPEVITEPGSYAGEAQTEANTTVEYSHDPLEVVQALLGAGMRIDDVGTHPFAPNAFRQGMVRTGHRWTAATSPWDTGLPLSYHIAAHRPAR